MKREVGLEEILGRRCYEQGLVEGVGGIIVWWGSHAGMEVFPDERKGGVCPVCTRSTDPPSRVVHGVKRFGLK